jgi:hypothetical protein
MVGNDAALPRLQGNIAEMFSSGTLLRKEASPVLPEAIDLGTALLRNRS